MSKSIDQIQNEIIQDFSRFNDWFEMYEYLIKLGKSLKSSDNDLKNEHYSITGCQSQVWIKAETIGQRIHFIADSDSLITKGIISLILRVVDNQLKSDIVNTNLYFIDKIGLGSNLSPSRVNGLKSIVNHIRSLAKINIIDK